MPPAPISMKKIDLRTWNILQLGLAFFLVFTAFTTQGFIEELVIQELSNSTESAGLVQKSGFYSLSVIYFVFTFANFLAPPIVNLLTAKWAMCLGGVCYGIFMAGFLKPTGWFLYFSSAILGFGAAVIWTGQGNYLTLNSDLETIGRNSGILWAMMQSALAVGGIFLYIEFRGKTQIGLGTVRIVYSVFTGLVAAGVLCLALLRRPPTRRESRRLSSSPISPRSNRQAAVASESQEDLIESFSARNPAVVDSVHSPESAEAIQVEMKTQTDLEQTHGNQWVKDLAKTMKLLATREMLYLAVVMGYTGVELTMWSGIYSTSMGNTLNFGKSVQQEIVALHGIFIGLGQIIGGGSFGLLGHKTNIYGRNPIIIFGAIVHFLCFFLVYINIPAAAPLGPTGDLAYLSPSNQYLALFCSFLFGLGDSSWNTQLYSILGSLYPDDSASAFALFKFFQSLFAAISFYYGSKLLLHYQLAILCGSCFVASLAFFPVEFLAQTRPNGIKTA